MTYKEKYSELHLKYEKAGKELETSFKCISEINGFGDVGDIDTYINSQKKFTFYRFQFENLLAYISEGKVDPDSEYIEKEYMYEFIKQDQRQKGVNWDDGDLYPGQSNKNGFYCELA